MGCSCSNQVRRADLLFCDYESVLKLLFYVLDFYEFCDGIGTALPGSTKDYLRSVRPEGMLFN